MFLRVWIIFFFVYNLVNADNYTKLNNNTILFDKDVLNNIFNYDFNYFKNIFELSQGKLESKQCHDDIALTLNGLRNFEDWALSMLDATGKLGSGILRGNIKSLGHYDECVETDAPDFTGQYCLSTLHMHSHNKQWNNVINTMTMGRIDKEKIEEKDRVIPDLLPRLSHIHLGVCVPSSCTAQDVQTLLNSVLQNLTQNTPLEISAKIQHGSCYVNKSKPWTREDIYFIWFVLFLILLVVAATLYSIFVPKHITENTGQQMLRSFSISENWNRFTDTETQGTFTSLEGIRVISSVWVIIAHKCFYIMQEPYINKTMLLKSIPMMRNMPLQNNSVPVETFLIMSGLLRAYILLRELQNNRHDYVSSVWKRFLRLTPAVAIVIAFYATVASRLGSGPNWYNFVIQPTTEACHTNWIYNLLYLNNYYHDNKFCVGQTWYLAADMQLFLVAPLLVYPIWRWPNKAKYIITSILIIATLIPFFYILQNSAVSTFLTGASYTQYLHYATYIHMHTQRRCASYIVGIGLGFIMFKLKDRKLELSKITIAVGWTLCLLMLYSVLFAPIKLFQFDYVYNVWEMALFGALYRPVWAIGIAWIVFACHFGYGGLVNKFLSAKVFQTLSKLSYCMFLTHYFVLMVNTGRIRTAVYFDEYMLACLIIGEVLSTIVASLFLHLFVEAPVHELVKIMQKKERVKAKTA